AAIEGGFEELGIYTWPGNLKAVPLYKKMGSFWSPDTGVYLQNFVPTILRMPLLEDFFRDRDWYATQERDLAVAEDLERWHGVRVYRYRFAAEGERIEILIDRLARMPTALETEALSLAAWVGAEELAALREHTLHYEFRNKAERPVAVGLVARGEGGVPFVLEESFELKGRRRMSVPFRLPADLERKAPGEPPHRVLSTVTVGGVPVRLGTAVRKRDPVEVDLDGGGFAAGRPAEVRIRLRNRLPFPASGVLRVGAPPGLERLEENLAFRIPRRGWSGASLRVRAEQPGGYPLEVRASFSEQTARRIAEGETPAPAARGRMHTLWLRAFAPGIFAMSEDAEKRVVTVESDQMLVRFQRVGGWLSVRDKALERDLMGVQMSDIGPPFREYQEVPPIYEVDALRTDGGLRLVTRRKPRRRPGLTLERSVLVTPQLVEMHHRLINATDKAADGVQVRVSANGHLGLGTITIPSGADMVRHERPGWGEWPGWGEIRRRSDQFGETWLAAEEKGAVAGVVWEGDAEVCPRSGGGAELTYGPLSVPAGGVVDLAPIRLVAGSGSHETVRSVWATYVRSEPLRTPEERNPVEKEALRGGLTQAPALLTRARQRVELELSAEQRRELSGNVALRLPDAVTLSDGRRQASFPISSLAAGTPWRREISLHRTADRPTAGVGELCLAAQRRDHSFPIPIVIVRAGRSRLRLRQEDDAIIVDTGCLRFRVSGSHGGGIVSLQMDGRELVRSSYPTPRPYHWMNPWYGGVRAAAGNPWDRRFQRVSRKIEPADVTGASGLRWRGARVTSMLTHRDLRWLRCEADYLATAGSNLLAVRVTVRNRTSAPMAADFHVGVWPSAETQTAHVDRAGEPKECRPDRYEYGVRAGRWLAFAAPQGPLLAAVAPRRERGWRLDMENMGEREFRASASRRAELGPETRQAREMVWLVGCRTLEEAHAYRFLAELKELP
ncbi:MAG: hypothetical protein ACYS8K_07440, partial [Planctomycetota bacterium]